MEKATQSKLDTVCYWLIHFTRLNGATELKVNQKGVSYKKESLGDWEIIVRKKGKGVN